MFNRSLNEHVMLTILVKEGPRAPPEPAREIPLLGPKTTFGGPLRTRMGPLIDEYV
jgi:hypothetical protein